MVRYTQDSWTNSSPSAVENLWGDDPFPAVDSNWDAAGPLPDGAAHPEHRVEGGQHPDLHVLGQRDHGDPRAAPTPELNDQINAAIPGIFPDSLKEYGADRGHPIFGGRGSYGDTLQNMAPFKNNQNLFVLKDDYSAVCGKHFFKAGHRRRATTRRTRTSSTRAPPSRRPFGDSVGLTGKATPPGTSSPTSCSAAWPSTSREPKADRSIQQRWRDVEAYVADSWKVQPARDAGLRPALVPVREPLRPRRHHLELRPVDLQPGPRQRRVQRHAGAPRLHRLPGRRAPGRDAGSEPGAREHEQLLRAAARDRVGRLGERQDGASAPASAGSSSASRSRTA